MFYENITIINFCIVEYNVFSTVLNNKVINH